MRLNLKSLVYDEELQKYYSFSKICHLIYDYVYFLGVRISEHKLFILAGGLAFNILLYIIPLVLILIYIINIFIKPDQLIEVIERALLDYLPYTEVYREIIREVIFEVQRISITSNVAGIIGFVILLWISSTAISTLNTCICYIFQTEQPSYFKTKLKDLGTTILLNILILIYCVLLPIISVVTTLFKSILPDEILPYLSSLTIRFSQLIVSFLLFYFVYWIVPAAKTRVHHWIAMRATIIATIATELARMLFTWYISTISNYSRFYGTYAVMVTMAVWLYYSCFIILFSAELSKYISYRKHLKHNVANIKKEYKKPKQTKKNAK
ncbi:MAG: YihY family inner membrane protein [Ignavibacteria bacterium]|nr:YihY family inner membrane protein [Ignavibacteria bacterium]